MKEEEEKEEKRTNPFIPQTREDYISMILVIIILLIGACIILGIIR